MDVSRKLFCCSFLLIALLLTGSIAQDSTNYTETASLWGEENNSTETENQVITTIPTDQTTTADPTTESTTEVTTAGGDNSTTSSQTVVSQESVVANATQPALSTSEEATVKQPTSQPETTTSGQATPTTTDSHSSHRVCGVPEEDIDAESPCHYNKHETYSRPENDGGRGNVPVNQWVVFTDQSEESCLRIPMQTPGNCFATGSCGSDSPFYLTGSSLPEENESATVVFCNTDRTQGSKIYLCCQQKINVTVHHCPGGYFVYKLEKQLQIDGNICLSKTDKTFYKSVKNKQQLEEYEDLNEEEKENVVTLVIGFVDAEMFKMKMADVEEVLAEKLKDAGVLSTDRKKRAAGHSSGIRVVTLYGFPTINEEEKEATYVITVHTANTLATQSQAFSVVGASPVVVCPSGRPLGCTTTGLARTREDRLWIAILVIIGVTAFIVALAFVAVWCFSARRRGRSGNLMVSSAYKEPLVGEDEMNNSYKQVQEDSGHVNHAMELESGYGVSIDNNQNHGENTLDHDKSLHPIEDNAV